MRQSSALCALLLVTLMMAAQVTAADLRPQQISSENDDNARRMYIVGLKQPSLAMQLALDSLQAAASTSSSSSSSSNSDPTSASQPSSGVAAAMASAAAAQHVSMLTAQAQSVASRALGAAAGQKLRALYTHSYAGFAAGPLTEQEVQDLQRSPEVARVVPARTFKLQMISTPSLLGLTQPSGAFQGKQQRTVWRCKALQGSRIENLLSCASLNGGKCRLELPAINLSGAGVHESPVQSGMSGPGVAKSLHSFTTETHQLLHSRDSCPSTHCCLSPRAHPLQNTLRDPFALIVGDSMHYYASSIAPLTRFNLTWPSA
jgi:hypothetical protein